MKTTIIFVCYGNICRSPMAEYLFKNMTGDTYNITSAATSDEETDSPVHYGTRRILDGLNIDCRGFAAHTLTKKECDQADYIIGMEAMNVRHIKYICGRGNEHKVYRLLDFTARPRDIADPWYTHDFDTTYKEITEGLEGLKKYLANSAQKERS